MESPTRKEYDARHSDQAVVRSFLKFMMLIFSSSVAGIVDCAARGHGHGYLLGTARTRTRRRLQFVSMTWYGRTMIITDGRATISTHVALIVRPWVGPDGFVIVHGVVKGYRCHLIGFDGCFLVCSTREG